MPKVSKPRSGSLQFYPRKRVKKFLHSVNWKNFKEIKNQGLFGFIVYKVSMASAIVKDLSEKSMSSKKQVAVPVTILEAPNMKVYSVRFYNHGKAIRDIVVSSDRELKRKVKVSNLNKALEKNIPDNYEEIKLIVYS